VKTCEEHGIDAFERLPAEQIGARSGSPVTIGGVLEPNAATVQPGLLARGLRRVALERGVRIHEHSPMVALDRGAPPVVRTPASAITAGAVVIATNAWAARMRELRRLIVPLGSDIAATEPIPERLAEIGWTGGEAISDSHLMVNYYRTTVDGRLVFGRGGGKLAFGGKVGNAFDGPSPRATAVTETMRALYPSFEHVPVTHSWMGPIDRTQVGLPFSCLVWWKGVEPRWQRCAAAVLATIPNSWIEAKR